MIQEGDSWLWDQDEFLDKRASEKPFSPFLTIPTPVELWGLPSSKRNEHSQLLQWRFLSQVTEDGTEDLPTAKILRYATSNNIKIKYNMSRSARP